jgi:hypothetical protein
MWFQSWFDSHAKRTSRRPSRPARRAADRSRQTRRLFLEGLEDRRVMAFVPAVNYPVDSAPQALVAADFNNDDQLDLVTANYSSSNVSVLLGNSAGEFQPALNSPTGANPRSVAVGDFNADGNLDLATANASDVSVLLGDGLGGFAAPASIGLGSSPSSVAVGDFNADGKLDLAVNGDFSSYVPPWGGCGYYACYGGGGYWTNQPYVSVLMGSGDGSFGFQASYNLWWSMNYWWGPSTTSFAVDDFNSDGQDDLAAVNTDYGRVAVLLNTGTGLGTPAYYTTDWYPRAVTAGDFTGDGILDLATAGSTVDILPGNGDGTFVGQVPQYVDPVAVAPADFNGDGHLDLVTADGNNAVSVLLGTGDGGLTLPLNFTAGSWPTAVAVGDFNGDDLPDVAAANSGSGDVSVLFNDGDWPALDAPSISITDVTVTEGNTGTLAVTFTVSLSATYGETVSVDFATVGGSATSDSDFDAVDGTLTFTPGQISQPITVQINPDRLAEYTEDFYVRLTSPTNAFVAIAQGVGTIIDDEPRVSIDFGPVYVTEGNTGTTNAKFTLRLSAPYDLPVNVDLSVVNGDTDYYIGDWYWGYTTYPPATLNTDFQGGSQTITFNPGDLTKEITVPVKGDRDGEPDEYFLVNLNSSDYGAIDASQAVGIIVNDEPHATISYGGTVVEGTTMTFTISLSNSSTDIVQVTYATADYGSATAGSDYVAKIGTATFNPGELTKTITVDTIDDRLGEYDEYLYVNLTGATGALLDYQTSASGYIQDNEPRLSINSVSLAEGNSGTKLMTFTVTLSAAYDQPVTVKYATQDSSAVAGQDYVATSGMLTFTPGQTSKPITVAIKGDKTKEYNEYFYVLLSDASSNAVFYYSSGSGSILNDDGAKGPRR